jgi:tetratricopeptide (TPR) repeat protein
MIVRNEAAMLPDCLKSTESVRSELIAVDTGSTDSTPEILARAGARVLHRQWRDDFADARNASIETATGDWVLWIDADERLRPADALKLPTLITEGHAHAYNVAILSPTGAGGHVSRAHRLFRNRRGIRFTGRIHEQISSSLAQTDSRVENADLYIDHLGYALPPEQMRLKNLRNLRLLTLARSADPRDSYIRFTLAQMLMITGDNPGAELELNAALGLLSAEPMRHPLPDDIRAAAWNNLAQCALARNDLATATRCARESLRIAPRQVTAHLMLYRVANAGERHKDALESLYHAARALDAPPREGGVAIEIAVDRGELQRAIGHCCVRLGRWVEGKAAFERAVACAAGRPAALTGLARCEMETGRFDRALDCAQAALALAPEDESTMELATVLLLKLGRFEAAALRLAELARRRPQDVLVRRRLAGVLVKAGRLQEAEGLLTLLRA